jgi:LacI family transcriptional regulator
VVLNGAKSNIRISPEVRERIIAAARELDYRPSATAQALASGKTRQIALLTSDDARRRGAGGQYPDLRGLIDVAAENDYRVVVLAMKDGREGGKQLENLIRDQICDGLCLFSDQVSEEQLAVIQRYTPPCVVIGDEPASIGVPDIPHALRVDFDNFHHASESVQWLAEQGHRRIAYISSEGEGNRPHARELREGYRYGMHKLRPVEEPIILPPFRSPEAIVDFVREGEVTAVVVRNLFNAIGWVTALLQAGISLPNELTVLAHVEPYDARTLAMSGWGNLLALHMHDWRRCGHLAGEALIHWAAGAPPKHRLRLAAPHRPGWCWEAMDMILAESQPGEYFG